MPEYYRLSKEDLEALDRWWEAYETLLFADERMRTPEDQSMREFIDRQKASIMAGKGKR